MQKSVSKKPAAIRAALSLSGVIAAAMIPAAAAAQTAPAAVPGPSISTALPDRLPAVTSETVTGADGVETITRTRRIVSQAPAAPGYPAQNYQAQPVQQYAYPAPAYQQAPAYPAQTYPVAAPTPVVFERDQWINECRRRTAGRSGRDSGQIIGGLLGALTGGFAGNRIASGERLGGTLIGAGAGGLAGAAIGNAIGGRDKDGGYDCEAALDNYLSQYTVPGGRVAARTIPATGPATGAYPGYAPQGYYPYQPVQTYQQPSQVVWVPVQVQQPQRVIVRETVREVPASAARTIPAPRRVPVPAGSKLIRE